ncbi:iron uptake system EfeUOB component EfeO/EfeM [Arthrobacter stackebrandtii]|uniref:Iron uptake system EfeUOB component EfeO/EfeM n=1 Tax=Arthrobacter stackebrandtii TaxID=272161 RepID=A0ABS4YS01_9MICC|nr:EfeM/EfeO family lipoprotein [Arthrobacter stackebrandtii]MBP2411544.1 iron uptake system EfeUOB component EfeO/EfeM [Arthrobacter stackebrandtii]
MTAEGKAAAPERGRLRREWALTALACTASATLLAAVVAGIPQSQPSAVGQAGVATVTVTDTACGAQLPQQPTGLRSFVVENSGSAPQEVYLVAMPAVGSVVRTIVLGPGTSVPLSAVLGPGQYAFQCLLGGQEQGRSPEFTVAGPVPEGANPGIAETFTGELQKADNLYLKYVDHVLEQLDADLGTLSASLASGDRGRAQSDWLTARREWSLLGAAYGSFGDLGESIAGSPDASLGAADPNFKGLLRIEHGLWHGESPESLVPLADAARADVAALSAQAPTLVVQKGSLPLRAHEILEDTLRDQLSGQADQGAGMALAITASDVSVTRTVVTDLAASLDSRRPGFTDEVAAGLDAIDAALAPLHDGDSWTRLQDASPAQRRQVNAAVSAALEVLADIPQLLILPQGSE